MSPCFRVVTASRTLGDHGEVIQWVVQLPEKYKNLDFIYTYE